MALPTVTNNAISHNPTKVLVTHMGTRTWPWRRTPVQRVNNAHPNALDEQAYVETLLNKNGKVNYKIVWARR
jgi:hypothetical protein